MRLQLIAAAFACTVSLAANAGGKASTRLDVYSDDNMDVIVPAVLGGWEEENWAVEGRYLADVISGATQVWTPDLISSATTFSEVRHSGGVAGTYKPAAEHAVTVGYDASLEPDYRTHAGSASYRVELFERSSTLSVGYGLSAETLGQVSDDTLAERTTTHRLDLGWDQIMGPSTAGALLLTGVASKCGREHGCLANPYRFVAVSMKDDAKLAVPERNPDSLYRTAIGGRLSQAVGKTAALHGGYRFYLDSWQVTGHTLDVGTKLMTLEDRLLLGLRTRLSTQTAASFFRGTYGGGHDFIVPVYRTADRELSGLRMFELAGRAGWTFQGVGPLDTLKISARLGRAWYRYPESPALPRRGAWLGGGGFDSTF